MIFASTYTQWLRDGTVGKWVVMREDDWTFFFLVEVGSSYIYGPDWTTGRKWN